MTDIVNDLESIFKYQTCQRSGCVVLSAVDEIERLRKERDEARRLASEYACITEMGVRAFARNKGWDCFKEETP